MKKHFIPSFFFLLFAQTMVFGQGPGTTQVKKNLQPKVQVTYAKKLGTTAPLKELVPVRTSNALKEKLGKKNKQAPKDFKNRSRNKVVRPALEHQGIDVIRQKEFNPQFSTTVIPSVNTKGLTSGTAPNDPTGDIGKNHYLQAINFTTLGVFDKQGNPVDTFEANTLWSALGFLSEGDPIVLYDQSVDRWIITEFPNGNELLIAVSADSDPMGSYDAYNFSTPEFPDYPKYGIWNDLITVTTNEGGPGSQSCYLLDKAALMAGANTVAIQRIELPGNNSTEAGFFVSTPVDWTGKNEPTDGPSFIILNDSSWGDSEEDQVEIYTVNPNFNNPDSTTFDQTSVVLSPFDGFPCSALSDFGFHCVPQLGGGGLDAIPEVIMNQPHYRNFISHESMVFNFITDVTDGENLSGIRWVELRKVPGGEWSLYQEGTFAPDDGLDRFMGSICMDGAGNIGLAYNVTSPDSYVGVRFTGRKATDPLGEMTIDEYVIAEGSNTIFSGGRFGDYAHMSIDPTDDKTFWFTTEYANGDDGGDVNTSITAFSIQLDTTDIGPTALITPKNNADLSDAEVIRIEVANLGLDTQQVFQVGYIFENELPIIESVNFLLFPDSTYEHTFTPTVNMSTLGDYSFKIFTSLANDEAIFNDTLVTTISNLPNTDAAISAILGLDNLICSDTILANIILTNKGADTLNTTTLEVTLNNTNYQTINWTGNLPMGENDTIPLTIIGLSEAVNQVSITSLQPNQVADEVAENDTFTRTFNILFDGTSVFINLDLDEFPEETTWEVTDSTGRILYAGGPYRSSGEVIEEICLSESSCFTFTIFDALEDGICCGYGFGSYNVTNAAGEILIASDGDFAAREVFEFCPVFTCRLGADISISTASNPNSTDGLIFITATNGSAPIQYSIDGGVTFQDNRIFNNLVSGLYQVYIKDSNDCVYQEEIMVDFITSTKELEPTYRITVFPNPTDGVLNLEVSGVNHSDVYLDVEIFNAVGQRMHNTNLTKYGDSYIGKVSLYHYPAGTYLIRLVNEDIARILRVVRK